MPIHEGTKRIVVCWDERLYILWDGVVGCNILVGMRWASG